MDRVRSSYALILLLGCASLLLAPARASADPQVSVRGGLGGGKRFADIGDEGVFELATRGDAMFGAPRPRAFRLGPAFELRTIDVYTLEASAGAGILIPMPGDFPIGVTGLLGYALRRDSENAPTGAVTVTWGYRGYNYHHWYGYGFNVYVRGHRDFADDSLYEITGGIEVDLMFTTFMPLFGGMTLMQGGDPDEPARR